MVAWSVGGATPLEVALVILPHSLMCVAQIPLVRSNLHSLDHTHRRKQQEEDTGFWCSVQPTVFFGSLPFYSQQSKHDMAFTASPFEACLPSIGIWISPEYTNFGIILVISFRTGKNITRRELLNLVS